MSRSSPDWTPAGNADDAADPWPDLAERLVLAALFAVALALRLYYVFHHDFDSDEWQHLHVVWAWTRGLLQYRDVFDNHMPLFHMLSAPLLARIGETPAILYDMRLAMIPFVLVTVWGTYLIGRRLLGRRAGLRAAALLGLIPNFLSRSIEYRPDILQTMFWILALSVLLGGRVHWRRCLASGLLLGLAAGSSLKSILLLFALGIAALALPLAIGRRPAPVPPLRWIACISAGLAGLVIPPVALALHFHIRGALRHFLYGTVLHNYVPRLGTWSRPLRALLFVPALVLVIVFARWLARTARRPEDGTRFVFLALVAGSFFAALHTLWPLFTTYDLLPFYPLLALLIVGTAPRFLRTRAVPVPGPSPWRRAVPAAVLLSLTGLIEIGWVMWREPPGHDGTRREVELLTQVLRLTDPGDSVLDMKGESVFRPRPIYSVLEGITRARMQEGSIVEPIEERVIATRTCLAAAKIDRFPEPTRRFIERNYLLVGEVRVAGRNLPKSADARGRIGFDIEIPAEYAVMTRKGPAAGLLDGEPYVGPRFLEAGRHAFTPAAPESRHALVWARAIERGCWPSCDHTTLTP